MQSLAIPVSTARERTLKMGARTHCREKVAHAQHLALFFSKGPSVM
jgi:hypothetical protein